MILKALTLENFKGIREPVRIEFSDITLLFGPNSAGKSTILHAMHYAKAILSTASAADRDTYRESSALTPTHGGFQELVNQHDLEKTIVLTFEIDNPYLAPDYGQQDRERALDDSLQVSRMPTGSLSSIASASIELRIGWDKTRAQAYVSYYAVTLDDVRFGVITFFPDDQEARITWLNYCHPLLIELDPQYPSYSDWLKDAGEPDPSDPAALEGADSNTGLERFVIEYNEEPWSGKQWPIRLKNQQHAIPAFSNGVVPALRKGMDRSSSISMEQIRADEICCSIACDILSEGFLTPAFSLHHLLRKSLFLGPLREILPRRLEFEAGALAEQWTTGLAAWATICNADACFVAEVNEWLSASNKLNCGYRVEAFHYRELPVTHPVSKLIFENQPVERTEDSSDLGSIPVRTRIRLRENDTNVEVSVQDVGVGISQMLPLVVAALHNSEGIIAIEQPELHIHPALQVRLGDLFASQIQVKRGIFLLETHSENLLLRLLRRIRETREGKLPDGAPSLVPEQVAVNYIERTPIGVRATRLRVDDEGDFIDEWPGGFFEESYREKFAGR